MNEGFLLCTILGGITLLLHTLIDLGEGDGWIDLGTLGYFLIGCGSVGLICSTFGVAGQYLYVVAISVGIFITILCRKLIRKLHLIGNACIDSVDFCGREAVAILPISKGKPGEVVVIVDNRKNYFLRALSETEITTGQKVKIVSMQGNIATVIKEKKS